MVACPAAAAFLILTLPYALGQEIGITDPEFILPVKAQFNLECKHDKPITWSFPPNNPESNTTKKNIYRQEENKYFAILRMKDLSFSDTGFYYCHEVNSSDLTTSPSIYLFIRDPSELFADSVNVKFIQASEGESVIIPCRPTTPDIQMHLYRNGIKLEMGEYNRTYSRYQSYDPKYGFTFGPVQLSDSEVFECIASWHQTEFFESMQTVQLLVHHAVAEVPRPTVTAVNPPEGFPAVQGGDITLDCLLMTVPGHNHILQWTIPNKENADRVNVTGIPSSKIHQGVTYDVTISRLQITNITLSDAGVYTCTVHDHAGNMNSNEYNLHVDTADSKYLNVTTEGNSRLVVRAGQAQAQWIVFVVANPPASISWYNPNGKELPLVSAKYTTEFSAGKSKVVVKQVSVEDSGIYVLIAKNAYKTVEFNITLIVEDIPHVTLIGETYYLTGVEYKLRCAVLAAPRADIFWTFNPCPHYPDCRPPTTPLLLNGEYMMMGDDDVRSESVLTLTADRTGQVTCNASNIHGSSFKTIPFLVTDIQQGFELTGPKEKVAGDNATFICGTSIYHYEGGFSWSFTNAFNQTRTITSSSFPGTFITEEQNSMSFLSTLQLINISKPLSGTYTCQVSTKYNNTVLEKYLHLTVKDLIPVKLKVSSNMDGFERKTEKGESLILDCSVIGYPPPSVLWRKDGEIIDTDSSLVRLEKHNQSLIIGHMVEELAGRYECIASNRGGSVVGSKTLYMRKVAKIWYFVILIILALIAVVCCILVFVFRRRLKKQKEAMNFAGLYNLTEGQTALINSQLDLTEQADLLPYDPRWEIPREKIKFGQQLGSGAFGVVIKAKVHDLEGSDEPLTVAVKMVKKNSNLLMVRNLASELKILAHLGKHLNVVNLIGACTENVTNYELLVVVEYCKYGNLHNYLQKHRNMFINQVDPATGCVDSNTRTIGKYNFSTSDGGFSKSVPQSTAETSANTMVTSLSTPVGEDGYLLTKDNDWNPQGSYQGDYKSTAVGPISTQDLLCWSYQIAKGMEYLASRKVLHGDLAARNVLLAERNIVKICDFGLAKNMYKDDNYCKKGTDLLPVKWMSIEALRDRIFSTQSDVWAFGVVLWELFSLARTPYPGIRFDQMFINSLIQGYRMEKPEYSPDRVYTLMLECWSYEPMSRPSFSESAERLGNLIEESIREHYSVLNDEYIKFNEILGQEDYLAMMAAPTFVNMTTPGRDDVRYVNMRPPAGPVEPIELKPMIASSPEITL